MQKRLEQFESLECLDEEWDESLNSVKSQFFEDSKQKLIHNRMPYDKALRIFDEYYQEREYEYENLMVYFIFRYGMKAVYDDSILDKMKFAVTSFLMIRDMDVQRFLHNNFQFSEFDRVDIVRIYSKEVEHSLENLETLSQAFLFEDIFQTESLIHQLMV